MQAYIDLRNFGQLPYPGGTFDQPAEILEEMRVVASEVNRAAKARDDKDRAAAEKLLARRGRN